MGMINAPLTISELFCWYAARKRGFCFVFHYELLTTTYKFFIRTPLKTKNSKLKTNFRVPPPPVLSLPLSKIFRATPVSHLQVPYFAKALVETPQK